MSHDQPLVPGTLLENRYRIVRLLGQGGVSRIYLAQDTRLGVCVALEENLQGTAEARLQFERTARYLVLLSHPNLPRVLDHFTDTQSGVQYLVMDYVDGEDLETMVRRVGPLPEATARGWIGQILSAVEYLNGQNPPVIYGDIKPANIKVTQQGKAVLVNLIATSCDPRAATLMGAQAVTPRYAPPEQYGMQTDERLGINVLGATLFTALTGKAPPEASLWLSGNDTLAPPDGVVPGNASPETQAAIGRAMELQTTQREPSIAQVPRAHGSPSAGQSPVKTVTRPAGGLQGRARVSRQRAPAARALNWVWGAAAVVAVSVAFAALVVCSLGAGTRLTPAPTLAPISAPLPVPTLAAPTIQRRGSDHAEMVYVPAGEFTMGSTRGDNNEKPAHEVYLDGFWIDRYEVTNAQYGTCVDAAKCPTVGDPSSTMRAAYYASPAYADYPVIWVSWSDAAAYCGWVEKRLPTEAEWEKAARGTDGREYPWGNTFNANRLNSAESNLGDTTLVGSYSSGASPYGAMDMAGNVWEWVADWHSDTYYASSPSLNPRGPDAGQYRVLRGGAWGIGANLARSAYRYYYAPAYRYYFIGFRCAQ